MEIKKEIKAVPFKAYEVTRNSDGKSEYCTLTRNTWNAIETGEFFAYNQNVYVEGEAVQCQECGDWTIYEVRGCCPHCANAIAWMNS